MLFSPAFYYTLTAHPINFVLGLELALITACFSAALVKCLAGLNRHWLRWLSFVLCCALGLLLRLLVLVTVAEPSASQCAWVATAMLCGAFATTALGLHGLRIRPQSDQPRARSWRWLRILQAAGIAIGLFATTVIFNDWLVQRELRRAEQTVTAILERLSAKYGSANAKTENAAVPLLEIERLAAEWRKTHPAPAEIVGVRAPEPIKGFEFLGHAAQKQKGLQLPALPLVQGEIDWSFFDGDLEDWNAHLEERREFVALLHRAANCEYLCAPLLPERREFEQLPTSFDAIQDAGDCLFREALLPAHRGDAESVYAAAGILWKLAGLLEQDPRLPFHGKGFTFRGWARRLVEMGLKIRPPSAAEALLFAHDETGIPEICHDAADYYYAENLDTIAQLTLRNEIPRIASDALTKTVHGYYAAWWRAFHVREAFALARGISDFEHTAIDQAQPANDFVATPVGMRQFISLGNFHYLPHRPLAGVAPAGRLATPRITQTAFAVLRAKAETGHWPETLEELVPDYLPTILLDPYNNRPPQMRRTETEVRIYSVGWDGKDDGGLNFGEPGFRGPDLIISLPQMPTDSGE